MESQKKKKLGAAGWKVGTVGEFLELTDEESAFIELKLDLAKAVRDERVRQNLTQNALKSLLGSSQSRVAKMEAGDPSVSIDLLVRSLLKLGYNRQDLARHVSHKQTNAQSSKSYHKPKAGSHRLVTA